MLSNVKGIKNLTLRNNKEVNEDSDYLGLIEMSLKEEWEQPENDHWDNFIEKVVK